MELTLDDLTQLDLRGIHLLEVERAGGARHENARICATGERGRGQDDCASPCCERLPSANGCNKSHDFLGEHNTVRAASVPSYIYEPRALALLCSPASIAMSGNPAATPAGVSQGLFNNRSFANDFIACSRDFAVDEAREHRPHLDIPALSSCNPSRSQGAKLSRSSAHCGW